MRKFKFGVDTFIWAEDFTEKDLWIVEKAAELGFEVIDFAVAHPDTFPVDQVKELLDKTEEFAKIRLETYKRLAGK